MAHMGIQCLGLGYIRIIWGLGYVPNEGKAQIAISKSLPYPHFGDFRPLSWGAIVQTPMCHTLILSTTHVAMPAQLVAVRYLARELGGKLGSLE